MAETKNVVSFDNVQRENALTGVVLRCTNIGNIENWKANRKNH